jgi:hypothetical protein
MLAPATAAVGPENVSPTGTPTGIDSPAAPQLTPEGHTAMEREVTAPQHDPSSVPQDMLLEAGSGGEGMLAVPVQAVLQPLDPADLVLSGSTEAIGTQNGDHAPGESSCQVPVASTPQTEPAPPSHAQQMPYEVIDLCDDATPVEVPGPPLDQAAGAHDSVSNILHTSL